MYQFFRASSVIILSSGKYFHETHLPTLCFKTQS
ncbi:hypothetical protein HDEF_2013 [Candidatus Hamiltonella defensa 5AT (Acyrthosiphon pisum)]|uniref:Uncharacterized protein n=1 Tax=Hamiltonella defensa subsp. Acyrthosiphon pisum (strain 5AT) TaxID=572265 RepID=C4K7P9_HAMD5|nr:hypothetical protein HDEF_2013 [Candidatus Hamiltonella defensa 5AT (Acyrthosiphon pisum)]